MRKIIALLIAVLSAVLPFSAYGDEYFIICQPESWVNVRKSPKKGAEIIGRYELGQKVESDGKKKNGYIHLINLSLEQTDGWISEGFVTGELTIRSEKRHINSNGRVACRRAVNGTRRQWLRDGDQITVYAWSDEWAVTNKGFIMTKYLGE